MANKKSTLRNIELRHLKPCCHTERIKILQSHQFQSYSCEAQLNLITFLSIVLLNAYMVKTQNSALIGVLHSRLK